MILRTQRFEHSTHMGFHFKCAQNKTGVRLRDQINYKPWGQLSFDFIVRNAFASMS
jgi:hypothetical protein